MVNKPNQEREKELIDNVAQSIVKHNMSAPAMIFLHTYKSMAWIGGSYALLFIQPFLPFYEEEGTELIQVLGEIKNIEMLLTKIEELNKEKSSNKKELNLLSKINKWISTLKKSARNIIKLSITRARVFRNRIIGY